MAHFGVRLSLLLILSISMPTLADDAKKETPNPDAGKYVVVGNLVGEIVKIEKDTLTVRQTTYTLQRPNNPGRGGRGRPAMGRPKAVYHDYLVKLTPGGLVRLRKLDPKRDDQGKIVPYTAEELKELRQPLGVPGYKGEFGDLKIDHIVEVRVVTERGTKMEPNQKNVLADRITILGTDNNSANNKVDRNR